MTATEIASLLAARADQVARHLLPNGARKGHDWCAGSTAGEAGNSCKVCVEGSKAGVWADFSEQGKKGDLIGLWQDAKGVDLATACAQALEWLGVSDGDDWGEPAPAKIIETKAPSQTWAKIQARMRKGTQAEISALAALRKIPATAGLELASSAGHLWFGDVWDDGFEWPAWIITDDTRRNAQARRVDGKMWKDNLKAKTIQGCEAKWPVGLQGVNGHDIAFVEGTPDLLAAWHLIWAKGLKDKISPVAMFGASMTIPPDALPMFSGKRVFVFPHNDANNEGKRAMEKWAGQMRSAKAAEIIPFNFNAIGVKDLNEMVSNITELPPLFISSRIELTAKPLTDFDLPSRDDGSVLIGDRYLSKGDGAILCSTSGMGKSSFSIQAATTWALGQPMFGGFHPSRPLKSLMFQSEDSEGDIAEVKLSLFHAMKLDDKQVATVGDNVVIVTDRIHRGDAFMVELKRQIGLHKPDLVWINPLLAFIGGDVNDAQEAGKFLREGLNSLNEPAQFAYIIVHHTSKPPKEKSDRKWNEVMYDMAGSADLTNWARAIISLRPGDDEGKFNLVLAKRGRRAGFTREKKGKIATFMEPVTTISVKHSTERFTPDRYEMPVIHWSVCDDVVESVGAGGRQRAAKLDKFIHVFGIGIDNSIGFRPMLRAAQEIQPTLSNTAFYNMLDAATEAGSVIVDKRNPRQPKYYVERPNVEPMFKE